MGDTWVDRGLGADDDATCSVSTVSAFRILPSSLSCQGAEEGQPVSYCETGSEGPFPIQVQLCLFSCCPRRKTVLLPCISEDIARFLYTSGTGENSKQGVPVTTEN